MKRWTFTVYDCTVWMKVMEDFWSRSGGLFSFDVMNVHYINIT